VERLRPDLRLVDGRSRPTTGRALAQKRVGAFNLLPLAARPAPRPTTPARSGPHRDPLGWERASRASRSRLVPP